MVPDNSTGIPRVPAYSGGILNIASFAYRAFTSFGPTFQSVPLAVNITYDAPITPAHALRHRRFGLFPVRSPLLGESCLLSLPAGTKMFQFPAFASCDPHDVRIAPDGLPHSEIHGSKGICPSPWLIAAYHVLHRLREPRHPPYALLVPYFSFHHSPTSLARRRKVNLFLISELEVR